MTTSRKTSAQPKRRQSKAPDASAEQTSAAAPSAARELTEVEVDAFARSLSDDVPRRSDAWWHYQAVLSDLGLGPARALADRAHAIEAEGGLTVESGERKRTLGGIFFALAREHLGPERWRALRQVARRQAQANPPPRRPSRPEPEVFVRRRS
jgi:hypothetical protein